MNNMTADLIDDLEAERERITKRADEISSHLTAIRDLVSRAETAEADARKAAATVAELTARVVDLEAILAYIDAHAPLADATCNQPGITLSEAARRAVAERRGDKPHQSNP